MFSQFFENFTFLDVVITLIIVWASYSGFRQGIFVEIFKIAALVIAVFIGLHFYLRLSGFLDGHLSSLHPISAILSFGLLIGVCIGIFRIIRDGIVVFFQQDELKRMSRYAGAFLGFFRALILGSIVLVGCVIMDQPRITRTVRNSFTNQFLLPLAPAIYSGVFYVVIRPIFVNEVKNTRIMDAVNEKRLRLDS